MATNSPTGVTSQVDKQESYLGADGMAEQWWSTISQRSSFLT
ncbi:MAG: hypothetical protein ABSE50_09960 [Xanthobacteraceae bacterium]|jgi:hypothetical protein